MLHWLPMICGEGEGAFVQAPKVRFVVPCNVKPADSKGHETVRLVSVTVEKATCGLFVLKTWFGPSASVAVIWERATDQNSLAKSSVKPPVIEH